jgi:BlaI family transcriptional regulator, penicillinase repressor
MKSAPRRPTEAELAILNVLWDHGPLSVREIQFLLSEQKVTGYTTALKFLQIMTAKELVERDDSVRPQIYRARLTRATTQRQLLRDLAKRAFGGSVRSLVLQALATKRTSPADLRAIEELLDRHEQGER